MNTPKYEMSCIQSEMHAEECVIHMHDLFLYKYAANIRTFTVRE